MIKYCRIYIGMLFVCGAILFYGCNADLRERIAKLERENQELKLELAAKSATTSVFKYIDDQIKEQEGQRKYPEESKRSLREYKDAMIDQINFSEESLIIESMQKVNAGLYKLIEHLEVTFDNLVEKTGGYDEMGNILNQRESRFTNEVIIESGAATELKNLIISNIEFCMDVLIKQGFSVDDLEFSMSINLDMEEEGKKWEEFYFKNMPIGALQPMFTKWKNDVKMTHIYVLEKLLNKTEKGVGDKK